MLLSISTRFHLRGGVDGARRSSYLKNRFLEGARFPEGAMEELKFNN